MAKPPELSACCSGPVVSDYYGNPDVPGCTVSFEVCSKCGRPHDDPRYDKWEQEQEPEAQP